MSIDSPIFVTAPPRSGTTMVAGLLKMHGVWIGEARVTSYPETNPQVGTENQEIKQLCKDIAQVTGYKNWHVPLPEPVFESGTAFAESVKQRVYTTGPWLVKTAWITIYYQLWHEAFPKAKWLLIQRSAEEIVASVKRHPVMQRHSEVQVRKFVDALHARMGKIQSTPGIKSLIVDPAKIASSDLRRIVEVLRFCDIEPKAEVINNWIHPEWWHGNKAQGNLTRPSKL